jgi:Flp pilus assembly pilin Flp
MLSSTLKSLKTDTKGASFMEYIVLVGLIAILAMGAYQIFGKSISTKVTEFGSTVSGIPGGG